MGADNYSDNSDDNNRDADDNDSDNVSIYQLHSLKNPFANR